MTTALLRATARTLPKTIMAATLALAATLASFALTTAPAFAAPRGAYAVTLASPLAQPRSEIVDGAVWRCQVDRCSAPADGARAITVCSKVARRFGQVARFATPQGEMAAEELARCNGG